jgi:hypothetical protein
MAVHRFSASHSPNASGVFLKRSFTLRIAFFVRSKAQEPLSHGSVRITVDVYAQAVTSAKRKAQGKAVAMLPETGKKTG